MKRTLIVLGLLLSAGVRTAHSQNPGQPAGGPGQMPVATGEIRGTVMDTTNAAAPVAVVRPSVTVRSKRDSVLIAGAIGNPDGTFRVQGLRPGTYVVRVTSIGYAPIRQEVTIAPAGPPANLSFRLTRVAVELTGVEVTDVRPMVQVEADRNSYRGKDVAPAAANANDILEAVPSVQVDGEGKISLRGNENVAIQINGRPAPIRGTQLTSFLKGIPANVVEKIEVIPNPSAKYDPEGMAGIINIALKQNADLGVSGGATVSGAEPDRYNASGNLGYQAGPLSTFSSFGFNSDDRGLTGINNREQLNALSTASAFTLQDILGQSGNDGQNFTTTADYKLNKRDVLTNALVISHRTSNEDSRYAYTELNSSRTLLDQYNRLRNSEAKSLMFDYNLVFKRTFEPRKKELTTELRFNRSDDDDFTRQWKSPLSGTGRVDFENDTNDGLTQQFTAQADYLRQFKPRTKLEAGYKGNVRWLDRNYLVEKDALGTGQWVRSNLSNDFQFDENVQAAYGVLSQGYGKFDLTGGLRAEYASRDFSLANPSKSYPFSYNSLFPSGAVAYKISDKTNVKASYSRRIRRPGTQELNPFPQFFDAQNVFIGNPNVNPEYTDAIELGWTRTGQLGLLQLSPFYRHTTDVIRIIVDTKAVIDGRDVTTITFKNLAKSDSWGTDLNGNLRLGPKLNAFAGFNIFKIVTDGGSTSALQSDAVTWSYRVNITSQLTKTLTVSAANFYRAPMNFERGRFSSFKFTNFSLRQKVKGDAMSVSLRFVDPFDWNGFKVRVGDDNLVQITERKFGVRGTFLSFQYNFGQAPKIRIPRPEETQQAPAFPSG
jgi:ferric enterobactin receptor